jgi:Flp pilus assembly protein TadD
VADATTGTADGTVKPLVAGALCGVAALLRPHALLLLIPGWLTLRGRARASFLLGALILIGPVVLFNSVRAGRPAGIGLSGGLNLYIGNQPTATGLFTTFEGFDPEQDPAGVAYLTERQGHTVSGRAGADRIWLNEALRVIGTDPIRTLGLWLRKVWFHWQAWEIAQITPLSAWPQAAPPLRLLVVPYGLIAALALWGLFYPGWREPRLRPWLVALALLIAGQSLFFVVTRYRLAVVPILCLLAGLSAAEGSALLVPAWRAKLGFAAAPQTRPTLRTRLAAGAVLLAAVVAVQPWGLGEIRRHWSALSDENEASRWGRWALRAEATPAERQSALDEAVRLYRRSLSRVPGRWLPYRGLARTWAAAGQTDSAIAHLEDGILRAEDPRLLRRELILTLLEQNRFEEALARVPAYLRDHPGDTDIRHNYVILLTETGRFEAAVAAARTLITLAPDDPRGYVDLGVLLARGGQRDAARTVFREGLERLPGHPDLKRNLDVLDRDRRGEAP